ncbi:MAG: hypothetical protein ABJB66_01235 [Gemmatimonadaceae bacterium]
MSAFAPTFIRRVALISAAIAFGTTAACVRSATIPARSSAAGIPMAFSRTVDEQTGDPPTVVIRDYWGAPSAAVVAWSADDNTQGLRTEVRRDGSIVHDHQVYLSTYALSNYKEFYGAQWHAFTTTANANANASINANTNAGGSGSFNKGKNKELVNDRNSDLAQPLPAYGMSRDIWNCKGAKACSPYETFSARVSDNLLRSAGDALVIKVRARNGSEEVVSLSHDLIKAYLKTVDSLSSSRKFVHTMSQRR